MNNSKNSKINKLYLDVYYDLIMKKIKRKEKIK